MTVRRYSLAYSQWVPLGLLVIGVMFAIGAWKLYQQLQDGWPGWPQLMFWAAWFSILMFVAFRAVTSAREIIVHENDEIEFVSALERQRVSARDIRAVQVRQGQYSQTVVRHASGTIVLSGPMNDFHQFITELQRANPAVELVGC